MPGKKIPKRISLWLGKKKWIYNAIEKRIKEADLVGVWRTQASVILEILEEGLKEYKEECSTEVRTEKIKRKAKTTTKLLWPFVQFPVEFEEDVKKLLQILDTKKNIEGVKTSLGYELGRILRYYFEEMEVSKLDKKILSGELEKELEKELEDK